MYVKRETLSFTSIMASPVPAKSQSLHNFPLPHLKCKKNRSRIADPSPHQSPTVDAPRIQSSRRDVSARRSPINHLAASRRLPMYSPATMRDLNGHESPARESEDRKYGARDSEKNGYIAPSSGLVTERCGKKMKVSEGKEAGSKIYIRLNKNAAGESPEEERTDEVKTCVVEGDVQESMPKTWNFRPRKPLYKPNYTSGGGLSRIGGSSSLQDNKGQLPQAAEAAANGSEKEKKQKFSISLSKEEIEEDVFSLTGSKPARRPKKRPRAVRKALDNLFPGVWLASITPDSYKVYENPAKG